MGRPRLPLTRLERNRLRPAQFASVVVALLGAITAVLALSQGYERIGALVILSAATYVAAVWAAALRLHWLFAVLASVSALAVFALAGHPVVGVFLALAFLGWITLRAGKKLDLEIRVVEPAEVDEESAANVAAFERLGFERVGALAFDPAPGKTVVAWAMLGPGADRYAIVTDLMLEVVSTFDDRLLTTRNSASLSLPPECLGNDLRGAAPDELVDAHEEALALLAARGLTPDRLDRDSVVDRQIRFEGRCAEWINARASARLTAAFSSGRGEGPLTDGVTGGRRVDAWLGSAA